MKKIWFYICAVAFIAVLGCSKEDSPGLTELTGLWSVDEIFLSDGSVTVEIGDTTLVGEYSLVGKEISTILVLNEDLSMSSDGQYIAETSYTIVDETITDEVPASDFGGRGTWYKDGRQIIIEQDSTFHALNIRSVNADSLSLFFPLNLTIEDEDIVSKFKGTLNYNLSR